MPCDPFCLTSTAPVAMAPSGWTVSWARCSGSRRALRCAATAHSNAARAQILTPQELAGAHFGDFSFPSGAVDAAGKRLIRCAIAKKTAEVRPWP